MKIRIGHVSNSSASSYMIGIGKISDMDILSKYMELVGVEFIQHYSTFFKLISFKELSHPEFEWNNYSSHTELTDKSIIVEASQNNESYVQLDVTDAKDTDLFLILSINNDEGDGPFMNYDANSNCGEIDYDIDYEYFDEIERHKYEAFKPENGVVQAQMRFGCGRNG